MRSAFAIILIVVASFALLLTYKPGFLQDENNGNSKQQVVVRDASLAAPPGSAGESPGQPADPLEVNLHAVDHLLNESRFDEAVQALDSLYPGLSSKELDQFKALFLDTANRLSLTQNNLLAKDMLVRYTASYDDTDAWNQLGNVLMMLEDWQPALNAFLRSSALEYRPEELVRKLSALVQTSSYVRAALEKQGDEHAIHNMYQNLNRLHPNYPRFQLELALSFLRLQQPGQARVLLEALMYDSEWGALARQNLRKIDASIAAESQSTKSQPDPGQDVVVPLTRLGDSFLVDVSINSRNIQLLLDTGASITALSQNAIKALKLRPTGNYIQLNTANGPRRAQLYQAGNIRIGNMVKQGFVIAEIDLAGSAAQGLLGTDLLNQMDSRYSYIIDNRKNALIFRSR